MVFKVELHWISELFSLVLAESWYQCKWWWRRQRWKG